MKKLFSVLTALAAVLSAGAQADKANFKVIPLVIKQTYYLSGGTRSAFGGISRQSLQVDLPPNTVEWYYAVSTTANRNQLGDIGLAAQLEKLLTPGLGIGSDVIPAVITPAGSGVCDIYLMVTSADAERFIAKQPSYAPVFEDTRQNFISGVVQVKDFVQGSCYLGLRNPSLSAGINIIIEVTAIVKNPPGSSLANLSQVSGKPL